MQSRVLMFCPLEPFRIYLFFSSFVASSSRHPLPETAAPSIKSLLGSYESNRLSQQRFRHFSRSRMTFPQENEEAKLGETTPQNRTQPYPYQGIIREELLNLGVRNEERNEA
jgi:hypothetical protein